VYRFLLRPRWLGFAALVVLLAITFVGLGRWQLDRLDQRRAQNARVEASRQAAPVPVDQLLSTDRPTAVRHEYRQVQVRGTYDADDEYLVAGRTLEDRPGSLVLTPLRTEGGPVLLVVRGWVPPAAGGAGAEPDVPAPPTGTVTVTGRVRASDSGRGAWHETTVGEHTQVRAIDAEKIARQLHEPAYRGYVELVDQEPAADDALATIPLPPLDEGPHLSYAVQWFLFAVLAFVGYGYLARHEAEHRRAGTTGTADTSGPDGRADPRSRAVPSLPDPNPDPDPAPTAGPTSPSDSLHPS
jgi:cytochrome oxidase assembly protein ShyY1